jgi:Fumarylacetoacetate (FAA) hydrolase family
MRSSSSSTALRRASGSERGGQVGETGERLPRADVRLRAPIVPKKFFHTDEAGDYIAGYTVFNDITARDIQRREMQSGVFSFSKAIDTFCPIGPWIVTKGDVPDTQALAMELRVNGQVRQRGNTAQNASAASASSAARP